MSRLCDRFDLCDFRLSRMSTTPRSSRSHVVAFTAVGLALVTGLSVGCLPTNDALDEKVVDWPTVPAPHIAHLRGRVINLQTGQPIAGAKVDVGTASAISAADGSYAIGDLHRTSVDLITSKVGYDTTFTLLPLPRGDTQFTVRLRASAVGASVETPSP